MPLATTLNFSNTTPAPPSGQQNNVWQNDGGSPTVNESNYTPAMVGDTGSGGLAGSAPAPPSGSAAAGKFLKADGTWAVPPGSGLGTFTDELITMSGTSGAFSHAPATLIGLFKNGQRLTQLTGSPDYSVSGAAITLTVAATGSDVYEAVYWH
jgi:hypothetical protein